MGGGCLKEGHFFIGVLIGGETYLILKKILWKGQPRILFYSKSHFFNGTHKVPEKGVKLFFRLVF